MRTGDAPSVAADARKLAEGLMEVMSALLTVIERETELARAGKVREAMALKAKKTELSRRYVGTIAHLKSSQSYIARATPELLTTLHRHHDTFRAMLNPSYELIQDSEANPHRIVISWLPGSAVATFGRIWL